MRDCNCFSEGDLPRNMSWCGALSLRLNHIVLNQHRRAEPESAPGPNKTEEQLREGEREREREGQKRTEEAFRDLHLAFEVTEK